MPRPALRHRLPGIGLVILIAGMAGGVAAAQTGDAAAALAQSGFAAVCTNPGQTAAVVDARMRAHVADAGGEGLPFTLDFYDTTLGDTHANVTPGTDRRCEVAFAGDHSAASVRMLITAMQGPPVFGTPTDMPEGFGPGPGTRFIEARLLNSRGTRAVVHIGLRPGPEGPETFINVERLPPPAD